MNGPDSGMAFGVMLGMLFLVVVGGAVGMGVALLIKKLFNLSMAASVGIGLVLVVVGGVGLFAVVFDDLTASWWAARTAKPVHFIVPKGFNGPLYVFFDANGPAVNEVDGKLEVPLSGGRSLRVKAGAGLESHYADFEARDTEGKKVPVFLDSGGVQYGLEYRGFWLGDQTGRTFGEAPTEMPK
ncbi:hypothetical protein [Myxococcus fulvus]|uniref:hypothetical protein n=1 Tax=Myxococcus fulvus TaxID=33 RepID=UPI0020BEF132|nr:hypothetical protein [Myxococcus fulvus]MCK8504072.1 hypothetical protein [Myxococcus fulvus]